MWCHRTAGRPAVGSPLAHGRLRQCIGGAFLFLFRLAARLPDRTGEFTCSRPSPQHAREMRSPWGLARPSVARRCSAPAPRPKRARGNRTRAGQPPARVGHCLRAWIMVRVGARSRGVAFCRPLEHQAQGEGGVERRRRDASPIMGADSGRPTCATSQVGRSVFGPRGSGRRALTRERTGGRRWPAGAGPG